MNLQKVGRLKAFWKNIIFDHMEKRITTIIIHLVGWIIFFSLPLVFLQRPQFQGVVHRSHFFALSIILFNSLLVAFFYLNTYLLLPSLFFKKKYGYYFLVIIGIIILVILIPEETRRLVQPLYGDSAFTTPGHLMPEAPSPENFRLRPWQLNRIFLTLLIWAMSTLLQVLQRWQSSEKRNKEIEMEKLHAELTYLKLQINPHFLFNTLNNIYSLASSRSPVTADAVLKLSGIMHYVVNDARQDLVPLEEEINYISNYIELQKLRSNEKLHVVFETSGDIQGQQIAPLILINFIENAFKHGISNHNETTISIRIRVKDSWLTMEVQNPVHHRPDMDDDTGMGLANAKRRLSLQYPGKHELIINPQKEIYHVRLKLNLI